MVVVKEAHRKISTLDTQLDSKYSSIFPYHLSGLPLGYSTTAGDGAENLVHIMSAETLHPHSAFPEELAVQRVDKWNTSPSGPLDRHIQTSSEDNGEHTSSGDHGNHGDHRDGGGGSDRDCPSDDERHERGADIQDDVVAAAKSEQNKEGARVALVQKSEEGTVDIKCHAPAMGVEGKSTRPIGDGDDTDIPSDKVESEPPDLVEPALLQKKGVVSDAMVKPEGETKTKLVEAVDVVQREANPSKPQGAQVLLRQAMSTRQLQNKYEEVFGVPTKVHNKDWILSKISEKVTLEVPAAKLLAQVGSKVQKQGPGGAIAAKVNEKQGGKEGGGTDVQTGQVRCSRNDGKNWRCSEMAVAGHKHCPKHMRWSVSGRNAAAKAQQQQHLASGGIKRPRWQSAVDSPSGVLHGGAGAPPIGMPPPHLMPGAPNPLVAAPLLSAAASALDELHSKQESDAQRQMRRMMPTAFAFAGWPGAPQMGFQPGAPGLPAAPHMGFMPSAALAHRPTPTKAPFSFDSLIAPNTSAGGPQAQGSQPGSSAAPAFPASAAAMTTTMAGSLSTGIDCTVELIPMPSAGSTSDSTAEVARSTVRTTLNLAILTSFDALHCSLASAVGAPRPAGGRHDPSALQIMYCDVTGTPTVLGGESWPMFVSRARSVYARILVPVDEALKNTVPAPRCAPTALPHHAQIPIPTASQMSAPALVAPQGAPAVPPTIADMQAQWATMGLDPNMMMAMMMYAAASQGTYHAA